tara:strand:+ start:97 stop:2223 length:2127 start_codon:yes stop_codon:yes gene_type:complete
MKKLLGIVVLGLLISIVEVNAAEPIVVRKDADSITFKHNQLGVFKRNKYAAKHCAQYGKFAYLFYGDKSNKQVIYHCSIENLTTSPTSGKKRLWTNKNKKNSATYKEAVKKQKELEKKKAEEKKRLEEEKKLAKQAEKERLAKIEKEKELAKQAEKKRLAKIKKEKEFELAENKFGTQCEGSVYKKRFKKGTNEYNNCVLDLAEDEKIAKQAEIEREKLKIIFVKNKVVNSELLPNVKNDTEDNHLIVDEFKQEKFDEFEKFKYTNLLFVIQKDFETSSVITNERQIQSQYLAGVRQERNLKYDNLERRAQAMSNQINILSNRYNVAVSRIPPRRDCSGPEIKTAGQLIACMAYGSGERNYASSIGSQLRSAQEEQQNLYDQLATVPPYLDKNVYQAYSFIEYDIEAVKEAKYEVLQMKENKFYKNSILIKEQEKFLSADNIRNDDKNYSSLIAKYKDQNEIVSWQKIKMKDLKITNIQSEIKKQFNSNEVINKRELLANLNIKSGSGSSWGSLWSETFTKKKKAKKIDDIRFNSVVIVKTESGLGSGFFVDNNKVITNYHVVENSSLISIKDKKGETSSAVLLKKDLNRDLALLQTNMMGQPVQFLTEPLSVGMEVQALGHPKGLKFSLTGGIVSGVRKMNSTYSATNDANVLFIQTDAAINKGNSGGPLFHKNYVVGVNTQGLAKDETEGLNFAVHVDEVQKFLKN